MDVRRRQLLRTDRDLLGEWDTAANHRLNRMLLFRFIQEANKDTCYRCGQRIEDVDDLSIDHKEPWRRADDPRVVFFDLENITFSHPACNAGASHGDLTQCKHGHEFDEENTYYPPKLNGKGRRCRTCQRRLNQEATTRKEQSRAASAVGV